MASWYGHPAAIMAYSFAVLQCIIPGIVRETQGEFFFGDGVRDYILYALLLSVITFNLGGNCMFCVVAIRDYQRRLFCMHGFSDLLMDRDAGFSQETDMLPTIDYTDPQNMRVWWMVRIVAKNFGYQFFCRIQSFLSFFLLTLFAMMAYLLGRAIEGEADIIALVLILIDVVLVTVVFVFLAYLANEVNRQAEQHRSILVRQRAFLMLDACLQPNESCQKRAGQYRSTVEITGPMIEALDLDNREEPIKFLGFGVNENFIRALGTVGAAAVSLGIRYVFV